MKPRRPKYKIRSLIDGKEFDCIQDVCEYYNMTYDQIAYRLDKISDYKDGMNFERFYDNTEALKSVEAIDSHLFTEKYGDKTVPIPGYEGKYTISTKGVIRNIQNHDRVIPITTQVTTKHKVILHSIDNKQTQTHSVINLMKKAFGDPEENETDVKDNQ